MNKKQIVLAMLLLASYMTHAQQWRVESKVNFEQHQSAYVATDSTHYTYRSDRGSDKLNQTISYDRADVYYVDTPNTGWKTSPTVVMTQTFDNNNNLRSYTSIWKGDTTSSRFWTYSTTGKVLQLDYWYGLDTYFACREKTFSAYNTNDHLEQQQFVRYAVQGTWTDSANTYYVYDTNSNVLVDSSVEFDAANTYLRTRVGYYYYDTLGRLSCSKQIYESKMNPISLDTTFNFYEYDSLDRVISYKNTSDSPSTVAVNTYTYAYYPNGDLKTTVYNNIMQVPDDSTEYRYDNKGRLIEKYRRLFVPTPNPPTAYYYKTEYHYQHHWSNNINKVTASNTSLKVYPVPATDLLYIRAELAASGQLQGVITDMQGRVLYQWRDEASKQYTKQIHLSHLPAGLYMLQLHTDSEVATKQFIKQ